MRICKVAGYAEHVLDNFIGVLFCTVIKCNGFEKIRFC